MHQGPFGIMVRTGLVVAAAIGAVACLGKGRGNGYFCHCYPFLVVSSCKFLVVTYEAVIGHKSIVVSIHCDKDHDRLHCT